jgi:Pyruvate/2-oxoacid:ferredoxin oxidoreductase delta subunit
LSEAGLWGAGDNIDLGIATTAIGQGRLAALSTHATLRKEELKEPQRPPEIGPSRLKLDFYEAKEPAVRSVENAAERLQKPGAEFDHGISEEQLLAEAQRCFSCGLCFNCERCWMYCTPSCFSKLSETRPGLYYRVKLDTCDGCKKCADECPCGFIDMV